MRFVLQRMMKAVGEGMRGGVVIGHTRSGKPIYKEHPLGAAPHTMLHHLRDWTSEDHADAADAHWKLGADVKASHDDRRFHTAQGHAHFHASMVPKAAQETHALAIPEGQHIVQTLHRAGQYAVYKRGAGDGKFAGKFGVTHTPSGLGAHMNLPTRASAVSLANHMHENAPTLAHDAKFGEVPDRKTQDEFSNHVSTGLNKIFP